MKMRNILVLLFYIPMIASAQKNHLQNSFVFNGKVLGQDTGFIRLSYVNANGEYIRDTAFLKNGNFTFTGFISEPTSAFLKGNIKSSSVDDINLTEIFLEATNMRGTIKLNDFKHIKMTGSHTQNEFKILYKQEEPILKEMESLMMEYSTISKTYENESNEAAKMNLREKTMAIKKRLDPFKNELREIELNFIWTHSMSYVSPFLMPPYLTDLSLDSLKLFYKNWHPSIQKCRTGKFVADEIRKKELSAIGTRAQDFTTKDINSNSLSLSNFKGKSYVLLDFWASWCSPCRKSNPHLRQLYSKYHLKGFEIIGISIDTSKSAWAEAISKDSIDIWYHVLGAKDFENQTDNDIVKKYEIPFIPVQILIDKEGVIVAKWNGQSKENEADLENMLLEIFK